MNFDLSVELADVRLDNPLIVASGEHGIDGKKIKEISMYGPGAICTKTILSLDPPCQDPRPCIASIKGGLVNSTLATHLKAEEWFTKEIKIAKEGKSKVIANLSGISPEDCANLASRAEKVGADIIELPTACTHFAENLGSIFPGMPVLPPEVYQPGPYEKNVKAVRESVSIPIIAKLSAMYHLDTVDWAKAAERGGADAIAAADTFGPVLAIDIATGQPLLGGPRGACGLSGPALKPLSLMMVLEAVQTVKLPVVGIGGIETWEDAIEYFMAGAKFIGICTAGHVKGPSLYRNVIDGIENYLRVKGFKELDDIIGLTQKKIKERKEQNTQAITKKIPPVIDYNLCDTCRVCIEPGNNTRCCLEGRFLYQGRGRQQCYNACAYDAINLVDGFPHIKEDNCWGCGLCVTVCPKKAIKSSYYKE
jgi:dihydroorotate dehydrogenase subfamily 1